MNGRHTITAQQTQKRQRMPNTPGTHNAPDLVLVTRTKHSQAGKET